MTDALALINNIYTALEKRERCVTMFVYLSKAFDCVNPQKLYHKHDAYGIRGIANKMIKCCQSNTQQYFLYIFWKVKPLYG